MKLFKLSLLCIFIAIASCGKVVQESTQKKEEPIFRLTYSIATVTRNALENDIHVEKPLYCVIYAYELDGKAKELSWGEGRATPKEIKVESKPSVKTYSSKPYTKKGIELTSADHTWTKVEIKLVNNKPEWNVESVELKRGSFGYVAASFTDPTHYRLKWISKAEVSGNISVELKHISLYDTFLSVLRLMRIQDGDPRLSYDEKFKAMFNEDFFQSLSYQLPPNTASEFNPKKPQFKFDRLLEKSLLSVWELYTVDPKDAVDYLNDIKPELLSNESKALLLKTIKGSMPPKSS